MFEAYIYLGNSRGTGFLSLPDGISHDFNLGEQVSITIYAEKKVEYYARIRKWRGLGVYVPRRIAIGNDLLQKMFRIEIEKVDGFRANVGTDGRLYLPSKRAHELNLDESKIVEVKGIKKRWNGSQPP